jgi:hypothetical protein
MFESVVIALPSPTKAADENPSSGTSRTGHAAGVPRSLDLVTFSRSQALFRLEYNF